MFTGEPDSGNVRAGLWYLMPEGPDRVDRDRSDADRILPPDERKRAAAFRDDEDRNRYLTSRVYLRLILGACLRRPPGSLLLGYEAGGRPVLQPADPTPRIRFSLSRSERAVMVGICRESDLGVDLEAVRPLDDLDQLAGRVLDPEERSRWSGFEGEDRLIQFYRYWTCKEAIMKALGRGLALAPDRIGLGFHDPAPPRVERLSLSEGVAPAGWTLRSTVIGGCACAAALPRAGADIETLWQGSELFEPGSEIPTL